jgi:hypothetical protein
MLAARENWVRRLRQAAVLTTACLAGVVLAGCSVGSGQGSGQVQGRAAASAVPLPPDPRTTSALLKIATVFNNDYDRGVYGPVYDRWDARSQAVITRAQYITRHKDCPSAPHASALVESATPGPHGAWLVDYEIGGQRLTDYWFYVHRRWVFDLVLSNPDSVRLYRMTPQQYAAATGCAHG